MSSVIVLGLSGPSCSGKTTLALSLIKLIPNTVVIHQDDYYKKDDQIPIHHETKQQDWDCPAAFDMEKLCSNIISTRASLERKVVATDQGSDKHDFHFASQWANPPEDVDKMAPKKTIGDLQRTLLDTLGINGVENIPFSVVLVDGILLFYDQDGNERDHPGRVCDAGLFVYAQYATLKARREARTGYTTKDGVWTDPPGYFDSIVWPNFIKYNSEFVTRFPEIISDNPVQIAANVTHDRTTSKEHSFLNNSVAICSSDMPVDLALKLCTKLVLTEWQRRRSEL
ncbi:ribosylnicotinamide kinase [Coemansia sp. RSA 2607]|nr:ribosylnicotinamide kinase [Coemansia sp. RSA 2607]